MTKITHHYRKNWPTSVVLIENGADKICLAVRSYNDQPCYIDRVSEKRAFGVMKLHNLDKEVKLSEVEDDLFDL